MTQKYQWLRDWRRRTKERAIEAFGSKCGICGYNKCINALEFHHLEPNEKEFNVGRLINNNWDKLVKELQKCICICSNCHREIHNRITVIPNDIKRFDVSFINYKSPKVYDIEPCPICGKDKLVIRKTCSIKCSNIFKYKTDWSKIDLESMIKEMNTTEISRKINVSYNLIVKRLKRLGLYKRTSRCS